MNKIRLFLLGCACLLGGGCSSPNASNFFLSSDVIVADARAKPATAPPPYTASEAQDAVTLAVVRQFWQDTARALGMPIKEVYVGIGPNHFDPDVTLLTRISNAGYKILPLSQGSRTDVMTATTSGPAEPDRRVALVIETLDLVDHYNAIVTGVWALGSGTPRTVNYRFRYSSGRWSVAR